MRFGWVTWREHFAMLLDERARQYDQRFEAQKEAVQIATVAIEKRFESVNEFRQTLSDQTKTFVRCDQLEALSSVVQALAARVDKMEGRSSGFSTGWAVLVGAVGVGLAIFAAFR